MAAIDSLLQSMLARGGSDLHLTVGLPPKARISGNLTPIADTPVTAEKMAVLLEEICPPARWKQFLEKKDLDLAHEIPGVARFLASKGEGFHHVCFEVDNLAEALIRLELDGLELIDTAPRRGAEGPVAFIHPRSCQGVLVELIEAPGGPAWRSLGYGPAA